MATKIVSVLLACLVTACGGGQATPEEIAQHDADMQAVANMKTIQPVQCVGTTQCR